MTKWTSHVAATAMLFVASAVLAQSASVKSAATAEVGSKLEVRWTGPNAKGDFVSIDTAGAPDHTYGPYAYPSAGNPVPARAAGSSTKSARVPPMIGEMGFVIHAIRRRLEKTRPCKSGATLACQIA